MGIIRTGDVRMRIGSLFSGMGGLDMAVAAHYGATVAWHVEFDKHPSAILAHHYPDIPNYGDVTAVDWSQVEPVDIITGGYPCQPFSHAGNRKGTNDERHLWPYVADALRVLRPRLAIFENVSGHLSLGFDEVLADLAALGFDAEWGVVSASDAGAPHRRQRLFIVAADAGGGQLSRPAQRADRLPVAAERGVRPVTLLPTPVASVSEPAPWKPGVEWWLQSRASRNLEAIVTGNTPLLPTPAVNDMGAGKTPQDWDEWTGAMRARHGNGNGHGKSLEIEAQRLLPTPKASDGPNGGPGMRNGRGVADALPGVVTQLLPTPSAADGMGGHLNRSGDRKHEKLLPGIARDEITATDFGPYTAAIRRWEAVLGRPAPSPTEPGTNGRPRLSPRFVEFLMGLPDGWVTGTGIPRNAQLKALGNGVVPAQAALALSLLLPRLDQP
jgi:DNA (cytosine-5)-methyltransferase 1